MKIPYMSLNFIHNELRAELDEAWRRVMDAEWFIQGENVGKFEAQFADYCGTRYAVGVGNGLDALRLILMAYGIGEGDEVIVPANTFIATALAVSYVGAIPVFVDADWDTATLDAEKLERAVTPKTRAIIMVHLYGRLAKVETIMKFAQERGIIVIEDSAQAHGAQHRGKKAGSFSHAAAFSFYPGKNLGALGDGGGVVTDDVSVYKKIKALQNYGSEHKYHHVYKGVNSRLDELQAAFLRVKLVHLDEWNQERKRIARIYSSEIRNENIRLLSNEAEEENVYHIYPIFCTSRDVLQKYLEKKGVATNIHYPVPVHLQPAYQELGLSEGMFPCAEKMAEQELSLPLYPGMKGEEIDYVVKCLNEYTVGKH